MLPDFLVIGAQKAGTTWLHQNLKAHPQIWLPPEKEIHFFDLPPLLPFAALALAPARSIRHWGRYRLRRDYRKVKAGEQPASWYLRYYFQPRTRRWYRSLFQPGPGQVAGETTPRYAVLGDRGVAKVHALLPDVKIIYLLRDPIERAWSDLAMFHSAKFGHAGLATVDEPRIFDFLCHSQQLAHSRYAANLARWERFYRPTQILVDFQDRMREAPGPLLHDIHRFLEVEVSERFVPSAASRKVNSHPYPAMPEHVAPILARLLIDDIEGMHRRFGNRYTAAWLAAARGYLA
jgi:hypothetical protein